MTGIIKPIGPQVSIASANTVGDSRLVRVINTGSADVLSFAYANASVYANITVSNTEALIIEKGSTDLLTGANMLAVPIAYRN